MNRPKKGFILGLNEELCLTNVISNISLHVVPVFRIAALSDPGGERHHVRRIASFAKQLYRRVGQRRLDPPSSYAVSVVGKVVYPFRPLDVPALFQNRPEMGHAPYTIKSRMHVT